MDTDLSQKAKHLFRALSHLKDDRSRVAFLEKECAGNPALKQAVIALWLSEEKVSSESTVAAIDPPWRKSPVIAPAPWPKPPGIKRFGAVKSGARAPEVGTVLVGKYELLEIVGQGGMGVVYRAREIPPPSRSVAIKLVKTDSTFHAPQERFQIEREALSLLDHPNIAAVLEASNTEEGYPFLVMEFFQGIPITVFCDSAKLDPMARLKLFLEVCDAIQHAHERGLVHRDIKPANILAGQTGGTRWVKVIDFGLAKVRSSLSANRKHLTRMGMVLGTLEYMSPEQAMARNDQVDARSDIYALGVLLFELMTGTTPLKKRSLLNQGTQEFLRKRGMGYIPKPSFKLSASTFLAQVAADRSSRPEELLTLLRDWLDDIILPALEKDPAHRYQTVREFTSDIRAFLEGRPVQRTRKKRNGSRGGGLGFLYRWLSVSLLIGLPAVLAFLLYWFWNQIFHGYPIP